MSTKAGKVETFFELSYEAFASDNDLVYDDLGVSKEDYLKSKLKLIKRIKLSTNARINKAKNESKLELALQKAQSILRSENESIRMDFKQLILSRSPQFQFRNIEKLDDNDLKDLLCDLDIIDVIEDLDKSDNAIK